MNRHFLPLLSLFAAAALSARAESQWREPVHFAWTNDATSGYSMFVVGNHPDIGDWDPLRSVPLAWHEGNVWSADIGIQAGTDLQYKFIRRATDNQGILRQPEDSDWFPAGDNLSTNIPADADAPFSGKRVVFRCPWDPPVNIVWAKLSGPSYDAVEGDFSATELRQTAPGRYEGFVGEPGEWMRFTFSGYENGEQKWYHFYGTEDEDFWSPLDAFCVDGGQVFDYEPAGGVSDSRIVSTNVNSSNPSTIAGREIRIYLPRGYDENTNRRYPVVYMTDGQQIFSDNPGASYGGWKADTAADREIRGGRMREAIIVGVPCREGSVPGFDYPGSARLWEYLPGTDCLMGNAELPGLGTDYADFLVHNVKPTLDWNFRTLPDRDNTAHVGSSAGGLFSYYVGVTYTNVFGLVGALSGVYTEAYIPKLRAWCFTNLPSVAMPKRIWLDTGTEETNIEGQNLYESNWNALTLLLYAGHVQNKSLHFGVYSGWEGEHNEPAWAARIADVYDFLLPVTDEFNPLLPRELSVAGNAISYPLYPGSSPSLLHYSSLVPLAAPSTNALGTVTDHPWSTGTFTPDAPGFYRLLDAPPPAQAP